MPFLSFIFFKCLLLLLEDIEYMFIAMQMTLYIWLYMKPDDTNQIQIPNSDKKGFL